LKADVMAKKQESKWNIEDMTDPEIYDAIRLMKSFKPDCACTQRRKKFQEFAQGTEGDTFSGPV